MLQQKKRARAKLGRVICSLSLLFAIGAAVWPASDVEAADTVVVSGKVYNATNGAGYPNAAVYLCGDNGYAYTDAGGAWRATLALGTGYCARVAGGGSSDLRLTAPNNNAAVGQVDSYEYQYAGRDCAQDQSCSEDGRKWDRPGDTGLDFAFGTAGLGGATSTPGVSHDAGLKLSSADGVVAVSVPGVTNGAACNISGDGHVEVKTDHPLIVGPYQVVCHNADGSLLTGLGTLSWNVKLGNKLKGYTAPTVILAGAGGQERTASGVVFDKKANTMAFTAAPDDIVAVRGTLPGRAWINYAAITLFIGLVLVAVGLAVGRTHTRQSYRDYLRSKYYNL